MIAAMLDDPGLDRLRTALAGYTVDAVDERLGLRGRAALDRTDLRGASRALAGGDAVETLVRLFVLGEDVPEAAAAAALAPLSLADAAAAGLTGRGADGVRALVDVRPYAESDASGGVDWWIVSDFAAEVRGGPLAEDHVLGVGPASLTLARATPREPVGRALDVGTGCGIQALHLARHAGSVVATDVDERALRLAATTAALSGQDWELRLGSLLEPVAGERFDLVVANPPFVVSPGGIEHVYRDGGLAGDGFSETLVRGLPSVLADGGRAQLLANWEIRADQTWDERVGGWLAGSGCDAWVWQREVADLGEYVTLWLRDAGERPGTERWNARYDQWTDWFAAAGVLAVGMGLVTIWRTGSTDPVVTCEDVPQAVEQPVAPHVSAWHPRQRWLRATDDRELARTALRAADGVVLDRSAVRGPTGWEDAAASLRQTSGLRWSVEIDTAVTALVAGCDGRVPVGDLAAVLAAAVGIPAEAVVAAALPVVRDLVSRGFLLPPEPSCGR